MDLIIGECSFSRFVFFFFWEKVFNKVFYFFIFQSSNKEEKWDKKLNNIFGLIFVIFCILLFLAIINANILNFVVKGEDHASNV